MCGNAMSSKLKNDKVFEMFVYRPAPPFASIALFAETFFTQSIKNIFFLKICEAK